MSKLRVGIGASLLGLLLAGCTATDLGPDYGTHNLPPCTAKGSVFADLPFDEWPQHYHSTVSDVVEAHVQNTDALVCTADSYADLDKPTTALVSLASTLPPWQDPQHLQHLSEADLGAVLLEFNRVYECSLLEQGMFLPVKVQPAVTVQGLYRQTITQQQQVIQQELATARPTLDRLLSLIGGVGRLKPVRMEVECLTRTSLDMRNVFGLVAEATSCLSRIGDARTSLRSPANP
jgi:hypothetical protein